MPAKKTAPKAAPAAPKVAPAAPKVAPAAPKAAPENWRVRVRMHRQGVGDCFLITFRTDGKPVHMLIDCGVLPGSPAGYNQLDAVKAAVRAEITAEGGRVDVLVVTHEHADHVSGFAPAANTAHFLDGITVGELWMAWTENPDDKLAQQLNGQLAMSVSVAAAVRPRLKEVVAQVTETRFAARVAGSLGDIDDILGNRGVEDGAAGGGRTPGMAAGPLAARLATTVRAAMDHAKTLVPEKNFRKLLPGGKVQVLPGVSEQKVRVFVLGPPHIENLDKSPRHGPGDDIFHLAAGDLRARAGNLLAAVHARASGNDDPDSQPFAEGVGVRGLRGRTTRSAKCRMSTGKRRGGASTRTGCWRRASSPCNSTRPPTTPAWSSPSSWWKPARCSFSPATPRSRTGKRGAT